MGKCKLLCSLHDKSWEIDKIIYGLVYWDLIVAINNRRVNTTAQIQIWPIVTNFHESISNAGNYTTKKVTWKKMFTANLGWNGKGHSLEKITKQSSNVSVVLLAVEIHLLKSGWFFELSPLVDKKRSTPVASDALSWSLSSSPVRSVKS